MERRYDPRIPTDLPGTLTRLTEPETRLPVVIQDISEGGLRFETREKLECGSFIVIEIEDSTLIGEIQYCRAGQAGYIAGIMVERVLMGTSDLSQIIESMLATT